MKKFVSDNKNQYQNLHPYRKQTKKGSPSKQVQQSTKKSFMSSNLINFDINCYPFMNQEIKNPKIYRTTLNSKISNDQLRKLMRLNHPNMINIQKITRGHNKEPNKSYQQEIYFSFYYEEVPYSLKYVALYQDRTNSILKKIAQINLVKLLTNLSEYLTKIGVFYLYNLGDIGVSKDGEIKVFVSPVLFCDDRQLRGDKSMIHVSIDKIVSWWETTIASSTILNPKSSNIVLPAGISIEDESSLDSIIKANQSSFIEKEASQLIGGEEYEENKDYRYSNSKESMIKNFPLKNSNNSIQSELSKISSIQINKIKKIDQEIKYIKQRLKNKRKLHKESQIFPQKKQKYRNMVESDRLQKKDLSSDKINESNVIQKIQQNINCINIYTHPKDSKNDSQQKIKKMTTQPIYSYKISPENLKPKNIKPSPPVIVHHPTFEPEDFPNSDSAQSVNTYDMELETEIEPAKAVKNNAFMSEQRQISEKNYRPSFESDHLNERRNQNQVVNKHVTESAGPLQFKNFVNRYIKPQFLAKKSNIYEDPMEYESQTSKSISKKKKRIIADLYETGKSANSHTQKSSSLNQRAQQACYKKKDSVFIMDVSNDKQRIKSTAKDSFTRTNSEIKLLPVRESSHERHNVQHLRSSKNGGIDSKINQRVKMVLQKTKNAIALLNRVKNCKSPPPKFH